MLSLPPRPVDSRPLTPEEQKARDTQDAEYRLQCAIVARDALQVGAAHMQAARGALVKALSCVVSDLTTARHISESIAALIESEGSSRARAAEMESLSRELGRAL